MSFIPTLKTPLHSRRADKRNTGKREYSRSNLRENVKFSDQLSSKSSPLLSDVEKSKRKRDAMEFLKKETQPNSNSVLDSILQKSRLRNSSTANADPINKKTYALIGEEPISSISDRTRRNILGNERVAQNVAKESRNYGRLNQQRTNRSYSNNSASDSRNKSLLNSLSEFGSKLLGSILYNETGTETELEHINQRNTILKERNDEELRALRWGHDLNSTINLQQEKLDKINREIETKKLMSINDPLYENKILQRQTEGLEDKLQTILKEISNDSNAKLLNELLSIKDELIGLKKKQESNNMKFESRFEDLKSEQQRNKRTFDRMITELEDKRDELDRQNDQIIRLLKRSTYKRNRKDYSEITDSSSDEEDYRPKLKSIKRRKLSGNALITKVEQLKKNMSKLAESSETNLQMANNLNK